MLRTRGQVKLVKFKSTSPTNVFLGQNKLLTIKHALQSTETIKNVCNKDNNYESEVLLSHTLRQ